MNTIRWLSTLWYGYLFPPSKLTNDFPLTGRRLGHVYMVGTVYFFAGSFLPMFAALGWFFYVVNHHTRDVAERLLSPYMNMDTGRIHNETLLVLAIVSFLLGFSSELLYLRGHLKKLGYTLAGVTGMSLGPLHRGSWLGTVWAVAWRVFIACLLWYGFEHALVGYLPEPPAQPTVELAQQLTGRNFLAFFLLAAVAAPVFEELVFRGFLYQAVRCTLLKGVTEDKPLNLTSAVSGFAFMSGLFAPVAMVALQYYDPQARSATLTNHYREHMLRNLLLMVGGGVLIGYLFQAVYLCRMAFKHRQRDVSLSEVLNGYLGNVTCGRWFAGLSWRLAACLFAFIALGTTLVCLALNPRQGIVTPDFVLTPRVCAIAAASIWLGFLLVAECLVHGFPVNIVVWLFRKFLRVTSKSNFRADFAAVVISGAVFSIEHMQFNPVTILMLFLMGCYLAEIYRRTGSLWPGIFVHAANNAYVCVLIYMERSA